MAGKDRFIVAQTASTMLLADTETGKCSEIEWTSGGNEKLLKINAENDLEERNV